MNQEYYQKWTDTIKKVQSPFQEMIELNVKTLQGMHYLKPEEIAQVKKPEELWEKQVKLLVENGHKALDHMQETFRIMEKALFSLTDEVRRQSKDK